MVEALGVEMVVCGATSLICGLGDGFVIGARAYSIPCIALGPQLGT